MQLREDLVDIQKKNLFRIMMQEEVSVLNKSQTDILKQSKNLCSPHPSYV